MNPETECEDTKLYVKINLGIVCQILGITLTYRGDGS